MKYFGIMAICAILTFPSNAEEFAAESDIFLVKTHAKYGKRSRVIVKYTHGWVDVVIERIQNALDDGGNPILLSSMNLNKVNGGSIFKQNQSVKDALWKDKSTLILTLESKTCTVSNIGLDIDEIEMSCE